MFRYNSWNGCAFSASTGLFLTSDPLDGMNYYPVTFHKWGYAFGNPINKTDPSGMLPSITGPLAFAICFDLHSITQGKGTWTITDRVGLITVQEAIDICKKAYSPSSWAGWEKSFGLDQGDDQLPTSAHQLFGRFVFERGKTHLEFGANDQLTRELAGSTSIRAIRSKYYQQGDYIDPTFYPFDKPQQLGVLALDLPDENTLRIGSLPIAWFLGSFWYQIQTLDNGSRVGFRIDNDTTLESGTHIEGRYPPGFEGSVERLLATEQIRGDDLLWKVLGKDIISILSPRSRNNTGDMLGGGNIIQTYSWTEKRNECLPKPLMRFLDTDILLNLFLDLEIWDDYKSQTQFPPSLSGVDLE